MYWGAVQWTGSKKGEGEMGYEDVLALGAAGDGALVMLGYGRYRCAAVAARGDRVAVAVSGFDLDSDAIGAEVPA
jgi:hypothetical protein